MQTERFTIVAVCFGLALLILAALFCYLWMYVHNVQHVAAAALEAHTTLYIKLTERLQALENSAYPRYLGTDIEPDCATPDPVWGEHDEAVRLALTQAIKPHHVLPNPDESGFFVTEPTPET